MASRSIATWGIYVALFLLIGLVPFLGYIAIGPVRITTMAIPVTIVVIHKRYYGACFGALMFGLTSIVSIFYTNPLLLNILGGWRAFTTLFVGRILLIIPLVIVIYLLTKLKVTNGYYYGFCCGLVTVVFNTIFVLLFFVIFGYKARTIATWFIILSLNITFEWIAIPIICIPIGKFAFFLYRQEQQQKQNSF